MVRRQNESLLSRNLTSPPRRLLLLKSNDLYLYGTNMDAYDDK